MNKNYLFMAALLLVLSSCTFTGNGGGPELPEEMHLWAVSAEASDSYGGAFGGNRDDQSAFAATGESDVAECGDNPRAWVISQEDDGLHWIELTYDKFVYVSGIKVAESFSPGAVVKIELKNGSDYFTMWEGKYTTKTCPYVLERKYSAMEGNITLNMTPFNTDTVRITLDTDVPGWNEIDVVQLSGYAQKWYLFNSTLVIEE